MSQFGPNSATGNQAYNNGYYAGRTPNNSNVDYNRLYKTYTDGMSWDVTGSTNTLTSATCGFSTTGTNTNVISYRNISKLEFGYDAHGDLFLGDELSPDNMRLWRKGTKERFDKDLFRKDEGDIVEAYTYILEEMRRFV